eukprot:3134854-Prymnesium_polylepis.1
MKARIRNCCSSHRPSRMLAGMSSDDLRSMRRGRNSARLKANVLALQVSAQVPKALARLAAALAKVHEQQHHSLARLHAAVALDGRPAPTLAIHPHRHGALAAERQQLVHLLLVAGALFDQALALQHVHLAERRALDAWQPVLLRGDVVLDRPEILLTPC